MNINLRRKKGGEGKSILHMCKIVILKIEEEEEEDTERDRAERLSCC